MTEVLPQRYAQWYDKQLSCMIKCGVDEMLPDIIEKFITRKLKALHISYIGDGPNVRNDHIKEPGE